MDKHCFSEMEPHTNKRKVIALNRDPKIEFPNILKVASMPEALAMAKREGDDVWICGCRIVYEEAMPFADCLYLTLITPNSRETSFSPHGNTCSPMSFLVAKVKARVIASPI